MMNLEKSNIEQYQYNIEDVLKNSTITFVQYENERDKIKTKGALRNTLHLYIDPYEIRKQCLTQWDFPLYMKSIKNHSELNKLIVNYQINVDNTEYVIKTHDNKVVGIPHISDMDKLSILIGIKIVKWINKDARGPIVIIDDLFPYLHGQWLDKFLVFIQYITYEYDVKILVFSRSEEANFIYDKIQGTPKKLVSALFSNEILCFSTNPKKPI